MKQEKITKLLEIMDELEEPSEEKYSNQEKRMSDNMPEQGKEYIARAIRKIKLAMKHYKISQDEMADKLGIRQSTISQWFSGKRKFPPAAIDDILEVLKISKEYVRSEEMTPEEGEQLFKCQELKHIQNHVAMAMEELICFTEKHYPKSTTHLLIGIEQTLFEYMEFMENDFKNNK